MNRLSYAQLYVSLSHTNPIGLIDLSDTTTVSVSVCAFFLTLLGLIAWLLHFLGSLTPTSVLVVTNLCVPLAGTLVGSMGEGLVEVLTKVVFFSAVFFAFFGSKISQSNSSYGPAIAYCSNDNHCKGEGILNGI